MSYECALQERQSQPTMSIRTRSSLQTLPQVIGKSFGEIAQYVGMRGGQITGAPYVAYFNMDMENLDIEIGFPVASPVQGSGAISPTEMPKGTYATCTHTGPYDQMVAAYEALMQFVALQGRASTGVAYEVYLNDPLTTPPSALKTQILFLLKE